MANTLRIKRRAAGGAAGAPASLSNAELAFNEQDNTLYYGFGTGGAGGTATNVIAIGGSGAFASAVSPAFTGTPTAPTASADTNTTQIATTAFVLAQASSVTPAINGTAAIGTSTRFARADHVHATDATRAALDSPTFTGTPAAPTATLGTSTTQIATTAFVMAQDAATRGYVDLAVQGLNPKQSVKAASTANIASLSGLLTIDGVTLAAGNRVLVKDQTTASANGVYIAGTGAWTRALDMSSFEEHTSAYLFVEQGTVNADIGFLCTTDSVGTLGSTAITFVQFTGAGNVTLATITGTLAVGKGGTGATTLTGYVKGAGTSALTAVTSIPNTDISGLGTMSTQGAGAVAITGGSITNLTTFDGITVDGGTF